MLFEYYCIVVPCFKDIPPSLLGLQVFMYEVRTIIGEEKFVEVYLSASLEACEKRDTKGLYRKARAGELPSFTGISSPYEPPEEPDLTIDTSTLTIETSLKLLLSRSGRC